MMGVKFSDPADWNRAADVLERLADDMRRGLLKSVEITITQNVVEVGSGRDNEYAGINRDASVTVVCGVGVVDWSPLREGNTDRT